MTGLAGQETRQERPALELADIVRAHAADLGPLVAAQRTALRAIANCRTEVLGGRRHACSSCGFEQVIFNSCRNRHCPRCQGRAQHEWVSRQVEHVLPVEYFHVVFTIPDGLHLFFLLGQAVAYNLLFAAVAETLTEVAANPDRLGAQLGFIGVLHTWTQTLLYHPHIHCLVPGGGLSPDRRRWIPSKTGYFLPVRVLGLVFRGKLLSKLETALETEKIKLTGQQGHKALRQAARKRWNVYAKPPFAGPEAVLRYLGRYTHRIAISNRRLLEFSNNQVTFSYRDRANGDRRRSMTLPAVEFLQRFVRHVVPGGFHRIRHFGFLANSVRREALALCRQLLEVGRVEPETKLAPDGSPEKDVAAAVTSAPICPRCRTGTMLLTETLLPQTTRWAWPGRSTSP